MREPFELIDGTIVDLAEVAVVSRLLRDGTAGSPGSHWYFTLVFRSGFRYNNAGGVDQKELLKEQWHHVTERVRKIDHPPQFHREYMGTPVIPAEQPRVGQ